MQKLRTVGCFLERGGKFLLLHRHPDKSHGNAWGLPAGKVDPGETDVEAILREVAEETGYVAAASELEFLGEQLFHFSDLELIFPTFRIRIGEEFQVEYNTSEHQAYRWVTAEECYDMPDLIRGLSDLLERVGYITPAKSRT